MNYQKAEENHALLVGVSKYQSTGDKEFADLPLSKNDPKGMRKFLRQSPLKFKEENIKLWIDPTFE